MSEGLNLRLLDVLAAMAASLVEELRADACAVSRVIGDVLILVHEEVGEGQTLQLGQGYLVTDYPQTAQVLATGMPCALTLDDVDVDSAEAAVLRDLGYRSLVMLPLELKGAVWGLVEVYRRAAEPFTDADVKRARKLARVQ